MRNYIRLAYRIAQKSNHKDHKLGAVLVSGGRILGCACNHSKWGACAERRCLRKNRYEGGTLYVVRSNGGCSKPCQRCWRVIKRAGIKEVVYISLDRKIERLVVNA